MDRVNCDGDCQPFRLDSTGIDDTGLEIFRSKISEILFVFDSPEGLICFIGACQKYNAICERQLKPHIEFEFGAAVNQTERRRFVAWNESDGPHGKDIDVHGVFSEWVEALDGFAPEAVYVDLVFSYIRRNFRSLQALLKKTGLCRHSITFRLPNDQGYPPLPDHDFFVLQAIAGVKGIYLLAQIDLNPQKREELVHYGCTALNSRYRFCLTSLYKNMKNDSHGVMAEVGNFVHFTFVEYMYGEPLVSRNNQDITSPTNKMLWALIKEFFL